VRGAAWAFPPGFNFPPLSVDVDVGAFFFAVPFPAAPDATTIPFLPAGFFFAGALRFTRR